MPEPYAEQLPEDYILITLVSEETPTEFVTDCLTGGELVLSYIDTWRRSFGEGISAAGSYKMQPGLKNANQLEVNAVSNAPDHMNVRVFDSVTQRGKRYILTGQEMGGVNLVVSSIRSATDETEGQVLQDGPEKAAALSGIGILLLAIDTQQRASGTSSS